VETKKPLSLAPAHFLVVAGLGAVLLAAGIGQQIAGRSKAQAPVPTPMVDGRGRAAVGSMAPDFALKNAATGQPVSLSALRGKPVWINFWATWCEACREEMPEMKTIYAQRKDQGLVILGVDVQESAEASNEYTAAGGYDWTFVVDSNGSVADRYHVYAIPTHFFIDTDGIIKAAHVGMVGGGNLDDYFAKIMP
jgi:cytochrome c biogenesis protein CcmG, thiol:disulfide interchange protein DsbE